MLSKLNHSIRYDNIRKQNKYWSNLASKKGYQTSMIKGITTHAPLDNNDGCQDTLTGKGTTHDTNFTVFQPILKNENLVHNKFPSATTDENLYLGESADEKYEIPEFNIGVRKPPPLFKDFTDNTDTDELLKSLKKDLIWAVTIGMNSETGSEKDLIGSWTDFKKKTSTSINQKSVLEYLPAVSKQPEYPVCKKFLDDLLEMMEDLELGHIFAHSDEQVYARSTFSGKIQSYTRM